MVGIAFCLVIFIGNGRAATVSNCAVLNSAGTTYNLTAGISNNTDNCIDITANNIIFDCQGYSVNCSSSCVSMHGITVAADNVTVKGCYVNGWDINIFFADNADDGKVYNLTSDVNIGWALTTTSNVDRLNLTNVTLRESYHQDFYSDGNCNFNFTNVIGSGNGAIGYYNSSRTMSNAAFSELWLCGADNSVFTNITVNGSTSLNNNGLFLQWTDNAILKNINSSNNYFGIEMKFSTNNTINNSVFNYNSGPALSIRSSTNNNIFSNSSFSNSGWGMDIEESTSNNTFYNNTISNNTNKGINFYYATISSPYTFYNNLFNNTNNLAQTSSSGISYWNTSKKTGTRIYSNGIQIGGNYWTNSSKNGYSDTCTDADKDGFCDTSYSTIMSGYDYLPLSDEYTTSNSTNTSLWLNNTQGNIQCTYPCTLNATAKSNTSGQYVAIYKNGTLLANATTNITNITQWSVGIYEITATTQGNSSYSPSSVTYYATINKGTTTINLAIDGTEGDISSVYPHQSNATGWSVNGGTVSLFNNGSGVSNPSISTQDAGIHNYTATLNHENYTANPVQRILTIAKGPTRMDTWINGYLNTTVTAVNGSTMNITGILNVTDTVCIASNFTGWVTNCGTSPYANTTFNVTVTGYPDIFNITVYHPATTNYLSSSITEYVIISNYSLEIRNVYDEITLNAICYNVTMMNSTWTYYGSGCGNQLIPFSQLPSGVVMVTFSNTSYISRNYYMTISPTVYSILTGYLIPSGYGSYITALVYSNSQPNGIPGAIISALKYINNSYVTVAQIETDTQGKGYLYLYPWANYKIYTTYGSLIDIIDSYYPNPNYVLYIDLSESSAIPNMTWVFDTVSYSLIPTSSYVSGLTTFTYTIMAQNSDLSSFSLFLDGIYGNTSINIYNSTSTSPSGGIITHSANVSAMNYDFIIATVEFTRNGYDEYYFGRTYLIEQVGNGTYSIYTALQNIKNGDYGLETDFAKYFLAFFVSFSIGAGVAVATKNGMYGVIMFLLILCFFALPVVGFISWGFVIALAFIAIGVNLAISYI